MTKSDPACPPLPDTPDALLADGWLRHENFGGFSDMLAPFWFRLAEGQVSAGLVVEARHCNEHLGTLHGGALMTFADMAGGFAVATALGHNRCATVQLQTHFVAVARRDEFVRCDPEIVRRTADLLFVRGVIRSPNRTVGTFDGIWKVLAGRG